MQNFNKRILRYMAGVSLADRSASVEVSSRCGFKPLTLVMSERRLRWDGLWKRRQGDGVLRKVMEMEVPGIRSRGRRKKTWMKNIEGDMC